MTERRNVASERRSVGPDPRWCKSSRTEQQHMYTVVSGNRPEHFESPREPRTGPHWNCRLPGICGMCLFVGHKRKGTERYGKDGPGLLRQIGRIYRIGKTDDGDPLAPCDGGRDTIQPNYPTLNMTIIPRTDGATERRTNVGMYIEATPPNLDGNTYNRSDLQEHGQVGRSVYRGIYF